MKKTLIKCSLIAAALVSTLNSQLSICSAQGSLTPPGGPAPTMITLSQVEPRTPISSAPYTISRPGSYYLTTNLNVTSGNAITINTNQVTLDLNGFTISSTAASANGDAIELAVPTNNNDITIFNGHIVSGVTNNSTVFSGPGFGFGIVPNGGVVQNVRVTGVSVSGCEYQGIYLGTSNNSIVEFCTVQNSSIIGIEAQTVSHSTANQCGTTAIIAITASDCSGAVIAGVNGTGVQSSTANNCYGSASGAGTGISTTIAIGCYGSAGTGGVGISANIANSCFSSTGDSAISHPYNMP